MSEPMLTVTVAQADEVVSGVRRFVLVRPDGRELPAWGPGAHIDLMLRGNLVRQYSLCGDPTDRTRWEIAVLLENVSTGGSGHLHKEVAVGDTILARGPRNHFELYQADQYVFIAGGIGITPLLPMIAHADRHGTTWTLHFAGRSRATMPYLHELSARFGAHIEAYPSDEGRRLSLDEAVGAAPASASVYACGPERLLSGVDAAAQGRPPGTVHLERFAPKPIEPRPNTAFTVELEASQLQLPVPRDRSILDVVRQAGIDVESSCEEGTCGTCETVVLEGALDHRDSVLSAFEQDLGDTMMICVSRACGKRLVLDL
ncbi:PDR/VanB family oxidoreductase [Microbacterium elymi]|uniref:PDR/VanB family oxidoreductase n=1 Tax=Microbacterium elymi TaxID=2909587 RepID=A0ABY5NHS2_9MICO|nr:PDR/VanB family oxidoreductase [Microbacterium elymi]UUT34698.1 PDR/VanB family oxidoreductase [Microbacterium elymi]